MNAATERFLIGAALFAFAAAAIFVLCFVAMNMDEAGLFHVLACKNYPFASLHLFREACGRQDSLITPFGWEIARSQAYVGIWHSVLYAPFYFTLHSQGGQYLFGLCFLIAFAYFMGRACARPWLGMALTLAFFPFVFQFVHDMGPVKYALLLFPLGAWFGKKILTLPPPLSYGYALAFAFLCVTAVEEKPFFLYLLPSLVLFVLALAPQGEAVMDRVRDALRVRGPLVAGAVLFGAGTLFLLLSDSTRGRDYFSWLTMIAEHDRKGVQWFELLFDFLFYWPSFAHNYFHLHDNTAGTVAFNICAAGFAVFLIAASVWAKIFYPKARWQLLLASFAASVIVFLAIGNTWAGHHFIFLWVPLLMLVIDMIAALPARWALGAGMIFCALNLAAVMNLTQQEVIDRSSPERAAIFHYFDDEDIAGDAIINYSSWGGYYIQSLYGPKNQLAIYTEPFGPEELREQSLSPVDAKAVVMLARVTGRKIYDICYGPPCTKEGLEQVYGGAVAFEDALPGLPNWHVWAGTLKK